MIFADRGTWPALVELSVQAAILTATLHLHRRAVGQGLFAHPLIVAPAVGLMAGDVGIGVIVGVALATPFEEIEHERDGGARGAGVAAGAGTAVALWLSDRIGLGGLLIESFSGAFFSWFFVALLGPLLSAARARAAASLPLHAGEDDGAIGRRLRWFHAQDVAAVASMTSMVALVGGCAAALTFDLRPSWIRHYPAWWTGLLLCIGLGRMMGSRHPREVPERTALAPGPSEGSPVPTAVGLRALLAEGSDPGSSLARASWVFALGPATASRTPEARRELRGWLLMLPLRAHSALLPAVLGAAAGALGKGADEQARTILLGHVDAGPTPDRTFWVELRRTVIVGGLLVLNVVGPLGLWAVLLGLAALDLLVRLWGFRAAVRHGALGVDELVAVPWGRMARGLRGTLLLLAIPAALFVVWLPYQLPSQLIAQFPAPWGVVGVPERWAVAFKLIPLVLATARPSWPVPVQLVLAWAALCALAAVVGQPLP